MEIKITDIAKQKIINAAKENNVQPSVRLYVTSAACSGAKFGIAFDEPKQNDVMTEIDGIEFITDTDYVPTYADGIKVDYVKGLKEGYIISSIRPIKSTCGTGCGSSCNNCKG
jgi:iron-sulfur cluster assembly accessory protein